MKGRIVRSRGAHAAVWVAALLVTSVAAAPGCSDDSSGTPTGTGGTGATGGTGGGAAAGGSSACDPSACPGTDTTCSYRTCFAEQCGTENALEGLPCTEDGGAVCDGLGNCVECVNDGQCPVEDDCVNHRCVGPGTNNGEPCLDESTCDSGFCVDGVCCSSACDGVCLSCLGASTGGDDGDCGYIPAGQDPDLECPTGKTCNGGGACVGCTHRWSGGYGDGTQDQFGEAVAADGTDVLATGRFRGSIDFGGGAISSAGGKRDVFVAKLDASGTELWAHGYGDGAEDQFGQDVAVDNAHNVLVTGRFKSSIDFGGGAIASTADKYDVFAAKLAANGSEVWAFGYGDGTQDQFGEAVAVDSSNNVLLAGRFRGGIDFGGGALSSVGGKYDVFVAKLAANGAEQWAHGYGDGTQDQYAEDIATDSSGNVLVVGRFRGSIDFGGGARTSTADKYDMFVTKLAPTGSELWTRVYGDGVRDQFLQAVAADSGGNVLVAGRLRGNVDIGLVNVTSAAAKYDVLVAKLDANGNTLWAHGYGDGTQDQHAEAIAVDSSDNVLVVGRFKGSIDFGGGALNSAAGKYDVFMAKLDPTGQHLCSQAYGDGTQDQHGQGAAVDSNDNSVLIGRFKSGIDFGGGLIASAADRYDMFIAELTP